MRLRAMLLAVATAGAASVAPMTAHAASIPQQALRLTAGAESAPGTWTPLRLDIGPHTTGHAYLGLFSNGPLNAVYQRYDSKTKKWSTIRPDSYGAVSVDTVTSGKTASISLRFRPDALYNAKPGASLKAIVDASHFASGRNINDASAKTLIRTATTKLAGVKNPSTKRGVLHPFTLTTTNTTKRNYRALAQDMDILGSSKTKLATAKDFQLQQWKTDAKGHSAWQNLTLVNKNGAVKATGITPATRALAPGASVTYTFRLAVRTTATPGIDTVGIRATATYGSQPVAVALGDYWGVLDWD
ncbi:hypothetical protein [Streptomyces sp. NPDC006446]|uniref:hypothetical protein n=1 Tax=Streptomyces sp. NPDC006446 TaxID=3154301 RepID=UPI0033A69809